MDILIDLYSDLLISLEPTIQYCFEVETRKEPFIDLLLHFNQNTLRFIENLLNFTDTSKLFEIQCISNILKYLVMHVLYL